MELPVEAEVVGDNIVMLAIGGSKSGIALALNVVVGCLLCLTLFVMLCLFKKLFTMGVYYCTTHFITAVLLTVVCSTINEVRGCFCCPELRYLPRDSAFDAQVVQG